MATLSEVKYGEIVAFMRKNGIRRLRDDALEIELSDAPATPSDEAPMVTPPSPPCNCPHDEAEHDPDGLCLRGCPPSVCATKRTGA